MERGSFYGAADEYGIPTRDLPQMLSKCEYGFPQGRVSEHAEEALDLTARFRRLVCVPEGRGSHSVSTKCRFVPMCQPFQELDSRAAFCCRHFQDVIEAGSEHEKIFVGIVDIEQRVKQRFEMFVVGYGGCCHFLANGTVFTAKVIQPSPASF